MDIFGKIALIIKERSMKYSTDLRVKVINFVKQGNSRKNTCQVFGIHINSLDKWLKMDRQGSLTDPKPRRTFKKIDPALLLKKVIENPNFLLKDFAAFFQTSSAAIRKAFDRFKITRKKRPRVTKSETKQNVNYFWHISQATKRKT